MNHIDIFCKFAKYMTMLVVGASMAISFNKLGLQMLFGIWAISLVLLFLALLVNYQDNK